MTKRVSIYVGPELGAYLTDGENRSGRINALAGRYGWILKGVRLELIEAEMDLIRDACNGLVFQPAQLGLPGLVTSVEDAIKLDGLDAKWSVDGPGLVEKLRACSRAELAWLVENVEKGGIK